ncbi:ADP-ribose pyrophosphatase YjhB, NUDIX family [Erythrobacter litoralis]|jgi:8-oxo-dGTP pyrophosphatase MutT (NUDIX family)|uniref:NUDIX hydrolase n=1 Tax=Erythrobacter TaxID=1041 RepID=UPI00054FCCEA|nr:NUDIX domain-containing protein [Erythrobacter litoralis]AOL22679.1 ADP-ribose pyrophosphatase YjhB, NUDIX family [Erythrobacter litoralis]MEE4338270.1 NUDIX domain-containing protein [Erythrobacter sp.]
MLHLIERLLPAPLHRALLPIAFRLRQYWRRWRGAPIAGCAVVIDNGSGEILLLRHSYGPRLWMLPSGGIGSHEEPEVAARREIAEELGIRLARIVPVAVLAEQVSGLPHSTHLFAATSNARPRPDQREVIEARFFPTHSLPEPLGQVTAARIAAWKARGTRAG